MTPDARRRAPPGGLPYGSPGPLTHTELFLWESAGFLIVPDALTAA
eukprot:SAG31_NODE_42492_length_271_cov_0.895349_1_plen_45_part_10